MSFLNLLVFGCALSTQGSPTPSQLQALKSLVPQQNISLKMTFLVQDIAQTFRTSQRLSYQYVEGNGNFKVKIIATNLSSSITIAETGEEFLQKLPSEPISIDLSSWEISNIFQKASLGSFFKFVEQKSQEPSRSDAKPSQNVGETDIAIVFRSSLFKRGMILSSGRNLSNGREVFPQNDPMITLFGRTSYDNKGRLKSCEFESNRNPGMKTMSGLEANIVRCQIEVEESTSSTIKKIERAPVRTKVRTGAGSKRV